jgi:hypothetical protein
MDAGIAATHLGELILGGLSFSYLYKILYGTLSNYYTQYGQVYTKSLLVTVELLLGFITALIILIGTPSLMQCRGYLSTSMRLLLKDSTSKMRNKPAARSESKLWNFVFLALLCFKVRSLSSGSGHETFGSSIVLLQFLIMAICLWYTQLNNDMIAGVIETNMYTADIVNVVYLTDIQDLLTTMQLLDIAWIGILVLELCATFYYIGKKSAL